MLDRPDVKVVSNPEFLREGSAVQDFLKPDRIVVGSTDQAAAIKVSSLYLGVAAPVIVTDPASAETIKYAANAFLATKLSFVNAVAAICEGVGADVNDVVLGLGYDKRIGQDFLRPGPGWGGSCFPKDSRGAAEDRRPTPATRSTCSRASSPSTTSSSSGWPTRSSRRRAATSPARPSASGG